MHARPARLLCVGRDIDHLRTRCAVLGHHGYDTQSATAPEAELLLRSQDFDLIIVSAFLEEWEKARVLSAAGKVPSLVLLGLVLAPELLIEVQKMLAEASLKTSK